MGKTDTHDDPQKSDLTGAPNENGAHRDQRCPSLCRDCLLAFDATSIGDPTKPPLQCPSCGSIRCISHPELHDLTIAHIDCDSFYASVEKRDAPDLVEKPVIIGGGRRGVVSAACYVARMYGVRSAMPMFKALDACPDAVVIHPNMEKYSRVGKEIRQLMQSVTPLVEPLSIDEAFLDLSGTQGLHHGSPAQTLAGLIKRIENEIGVPASVGLSHNKFLAKIASDLDKPKGFAIIGKAETQSFLENKPVSMIYGVGRALEKKLRQEGIETVGQLRAVDPRHLSGRFGSIGERLYSLSRGIDHRPVNPHSETKSISAETTFESDLQNLPDLADRLWPLCETVAKRLKKSNFAAGGVQLKLRSHDFKIITRSRKLSTPTQLAEILFQTGLQLLEPEIGAQKYRLLGIGAETLTDPKDADIPDLADPDRSKQARIEKVMDDIRQKLGRDSVIKGRSL